MTASASDVAIGIRQSLESIGGVSRLSVTTSGNVITVKARIDPERAPAVQEVLDGYRECGILITLDRRAV